MRKWIIGLLLFSSIHINAQDVMRLVILHHNDTHSQIDPVDNNASQNAGLGGILRQAAYIDSVRGENPNLLLFHSGDFVQGTPYFNLFGGTADVACMNFLHYDAVCLGNHEFDNGMEKLAVMLRSAHFPVVVSNIDVEDTPLKGLVKPYLVLQREDVKIGILGLMVNPENLIAEANYQGMVYFDPIKKADEIAQFLKEKEKCDLIICLSHLGYIPGDKTIDDSQLAQNSHNIDIILGGHSHTLFRFPDRCLDLDGKAVLINQVGKQGAYMGHLDVLLEREIGE